jgi:hypothetical protein
MYVWVCVSSNEQGQWRGGVHHGEGTMSHCSGVSYSGLWVNGRPTGKGVSIIIIWPLYICIYPICPPLKYISFLFPSIQRTLFIDFHQDIQYFSWVCILFKELFRMYPVLHNVLCHRRVSVPEISRRRRQGGGRTSPGRKIQHPLPLSRLQRSYSHFRYM